MTGRKLSRKELLEFLIYQLSLPDTHHSNLKDTKRDFLPSPSPSIFKQPSISFRTTLNELKQKNRGRSLKRSSSKSRTSSKGRLKIW